MDNADRLFIPGHAYEADDGEESEEEAVTSSDDSEPDYGIEGGPVTPAEPLTDIHPNIEEPEPARQPLVRDLEFEAQTKAKQIKAVVLELLEGKIQFFSAADKENFGFLAETTDLVLSYLTEQTDVVRAVPQYSVLLRAFISTLNETLSSILKIKRKEGVMTDSFEVFELAIRRYLEQFKRMFPIGQIVSPTSVIVDPEARMVWEKHFGAQHFIRFELFEHEIIAKEFPKKDRLVNFLRLFLNFPQDDLITTYKWSNITRLFGPYANFIENFSSFALGQGFLGLINRVRAREILLLEPGSEPMYLVRFSRTIPDYLAFSYRSNGTVGHYVNRNDSGDIIPIKSFLSKKLSAAKPVNKAVNVDAIVGPGGAKTLDRYASGYSAGYICIHNS